MLLAIDIGNTNIHNGLFKDTLLKKVFKMPTCLRNLKTEYFRKMKPYIEKIDYVVVVSVVPEMTKRIEEILGCMLEREIFVVGRDVDSGVKNLYKRQKEVGQDRLVNARAAYELYGGESIVVDFGTAITIDIVNKNKEYIGGVIAPGVEISLNALSEHTALLPKVQIKKPGSILGRRTVQSMVSGVVYGFSSLCDGLVGKLKKRYCKNAHVIATGGLSRLIGPYCESVEKIDPHLTLKGLELISRENNV